VRRDPPTLAKVRAPSDRSLQAPAARAVAHIRRRPAPLDVSADRGCGPAVAYRADRVERLWRHASRQPSIAAIHRGRSLFQMPTYIMLTTLTPEGVQTVKNNPERIKEVNKEVEQLGASVQAQWATLGHIDFISIVEAPDEGAMARISLELGSRGTARYETLAAIPIDDFIASL